MMDGRRVLVAFVALARSASGGSLKAIVSPKKGASRSALMFGPEDGLFGGSVGSFAVATLDEGNGTIVSVTSPYVAFADDSVMPGCNAAAAPGGYWKTSPIEATMVDKNASEFPNCAGCVTGSGHCCADPTDPAMTPTCFKDACSKIPAGAVGGIYSLFLDAATGEVTSNDTFALPAVSPPFAAWDDAIHKAWAVVPYSYTATGLFLLDYANATATKVADFPKKNTDGVGVCEGRVFTAKTSGKKSLAYQFGGTPNDELRVLDLDAGANYSQVAALPGFYAGLANDPLDATKLFAVVNVKNAGIDLVHIDPTDANATKTLLAITSTPNGRMLRAQDQADFAVNADGTRAWLVASYNVDDGKLVRGLFTVDVAADRSSASLVSTVEAFSDDDGKPWFGTLDYFP